MVTDLTAANGSVVGGRNSSSLPVQPLIPPDATNSAAVTEDDPSQLMLLVVFVLLLASTQLGAETVALPVKLRPRASDSTHPLLAVFAVDAALTVTDLTPMTWSSVVVTVAVLVNCTPPGAGLCTTGVVAVAPRYATVVASDVRPKSAQNRFRPSVEVPLVARSRATTRTAASSDICSRDFTSQMRARTSATPVIAISGMASKPVIRVTE